MIYLADICLPDRHAADQNNHFNLILPTASVSCCKIAEALIGPDWSRQCMVRRRTAKEKVWRENKSAAMYSAFE
jgi:hypothetical protein